MEYEEMIQTIRRFVETGKLDGAVIDVPFNACILSMRNIRIEHDMVYFDQYRRFPDWEEGRWETTSTDTPLCDHVKSYVESVMHKMSELVNIDRNLF